MQALTLGSSCGRCDIQIENAWRSMRPFAAACVLAL